MATEKKKPADKTPRINLKVAFEGDPGHPGGGPRRCVSARR